MDQPFPNCDCEWCNALRNTNSRPKIVNSTKSSFSGRAEARKRIIRDIREWNQFSNEVPNITAEPLEHNLFEWHCNMYINGSGSGSGSGSSKQSPIAHIPFHLILKFPDSYPWQPPKISVCSYINHPNVFGDWICLDLLKSYTRCKPYQGWSSAYSAFSILFQLQSFLFGDSADQDYGKAIKTKKYFVKGKTQMLSSAKVFRCLDCKHSYKKPFPALNFPWPPALPMVVREKAKALGIRTIITKGTTTTQKSGKTTWAAVSASSTNVNNGGGGGFQIYDNRTVSSNFRKVLNSSKKYKQTDDLFSGSGSSGSGKKGKNKNKNKNKKNQSKKTPQNFSNSNNNKNKKGSKKRRRNKKKIKVLLETNFTYSDPNSNPKDVMVNNNNKHQQRALVVGNGSRSNGGSGHPQFLSSTSIRYPSLPSNQQYMKKRKLQPTPKATVAAVAVVPQRKQQRKEERKPVMRPKCVKPLLCMASDDTQTLIVRFLQLRDIFNLRNVNRFWRKFVNSKHLIEMHRFGCWYHRINLAYAERTVRKFKMSLGNNAQLNRRKKRRAFANVKEDIPLLENIVLGYGINVEFFGDEQKLSNKHDQKNNNSSTNSNNNSSNSSSDNNNNKPRKVGWYASHNRFFDCTFAEQESRQLSFNSLKKANVANVQFPGIPESKSRMKSLSVSNKRRGLEFPRMMAAETSFDLLSFSAFSKNGVRKSAWKEMSFTDWIPIYITKKHGKRALELLESQCLLIFQKKDPRISTFNPLMGLHLVSTIMNSLAVSLMKNSCQLHTSIKVVECYFHFYHLLLALYGKYVQIRRYVNLKCQQFVRFPEFREKRYIPNLGELYVYFSLWNGNNHQCNDFLKYAKHKISIDWPLICKSVLHESMIRHMRWNIRECPELKEITAQNKLNRVQKVLKTRETANKILMFQYFFFKNCCGMNDKIQKNADQKLLEFNNNFGCAPRNLPLKFQVFCKAIESVKSWSAFFAVLERPSISKNGLLAWLENCLSTSEKRGYHYVYRSRYQARCDALQQQQQQKQQQRNRETVPKYQQPLNRERVRITLNIPVRR